MNQNQSNNQPSLILSLPNTSFYQITEEEPKKVILQGTAKIYFHKENTFLCKINDFQYETRSKETNLYKIDKYHYVLPKDSTFYGIMLSRSLSNETFSILEDLIQHTKFSSVNLNSDVIVEEFEEKEIPNKPQQNKSSLQETISKKEIQKIIREDEKEEEEEKGEGNNKNEKEQENKSEKEQENKRESESERQREGERRNPQIQEDKINSLGELFGNTLVKGATYLSDYGIKPCGNFIKNRINQPKPEEEKKISEEAKENFKKARVFSEELVGASIAISGVVIDFSRNYFNKIGSFFSTGSSPKPPSKFWKIVGSSIGAITKVVEGGIDAGAIIATSSLESTAIILERKYGNDVGEVAKEVTSSITNLVLAKNHLKKIHTTAFRTVVLKEKPKQILPEFVSQTSEQTNEKENF
ncbi:spartin [Anaeramoeba flamelloides]|uniref:Spartin n=1 Tax=Anaeramoeba flamelloides TaxID=1746091 RepID=A0ABQ8XX09_9EUKA|nr:spartin [Anaeramoeba flamelloides]